MTASFVINLPVKDALNAMSEHLRPHGVEILIKAWPRAGSFIAVGGALNLIVVAATIVWMYVVRTYRALSLLT